MIAVVKLGGSLSTAGTVRSWLAALKPFIGRIVVVPGGGVFADTVRSAQNRFGLSDHAAHHMAILAMEQYGLMLADLDPVLLPFRTLNEAGEALVTGRIPVWLPATMTADAGDIHEGWDVTSDSLAAWLAGRFGAARLVLIKSTHKPTGINAVEDWAASGLVDSALPAMVIDKRCRATCLGPGDQDRLAQALGFA